MVVVLLLSRHKLWNLNPEGVNYGSVYWHYFYIFNMFNVLKAIPYIKCQDYFKKTKYHRKRAFFLNGDHFKGCCEPNNIE